MKTIQHDSPMGELIVHTIGGRVVAVGEPVTVTDQQAAELFAQARDRWTEVPAAEPTLKRKPRAATPTPDPDTEKAVN